MEEKEIVSEKSFLKSRLKRPKKEFKVKCLGWCDKEFMSESKFVRFCEKCRSKRTKIIEDSSCLEGKSIPSGMYVEKEGFDF